MTRVAGGSHSHPLPSLPPTPATTSAVLILGASVRAAACSARRAGLDPIGIDLFADRDLDLIAPTLRIPREDYPARLGRLTAEVPPCPWFYTGGLENEPELIDEIARSRPLWGNSGTVLRVVRDPFLVAEQLRVAQLPRPAVRRSPDGLPRDGSWLVKPIAGAGGLGIVPLDAFHHPEGSPVYYQERIAGPSHSALFVGLGDDASLVGITRQWVAPFVYAGSLGPWPVSPLERTRIEVVGRTAARGFGLIGLFGIDFILQAGIPYPVEINPRYTAAVEVLELATGVSLVSTHRMACESGRLERPLETRGRVVGKLILFAPQGGRFPALETALAERFAVPRLADIPQRGATFTTGEPVLTVLASGPTPGICRARLIRRRAYWLRRLFRGS